MLAHWRHRGHRNAFRAAALTLSLLLLVPTAVRGADPKSSLAPTTPLAESGSTIQLPDGPLTRIFVSTDLNCAVSHISDASNEFYSDTACGTLVAADGTLYGPADIPAGGGASPRTAYTPLSQTPVTGTGTTLDPYQIITEVQLGSSGLRIQQTDRYVAGEEAYRTDVTLINDEPYPRSATIYRAGDCYLQDSDWGFGSADNATGAVACIGTDDGGATPGSRREEWIPLQGASHFYESFYDSVWTRIGQQQDFPDSADSDVYPRQRRRPQLVCDPQRFVVGHRRPAHFVFSGAGLRLVLSE